MKSVCEFWPRQWRMTTAAMMWMALIAMPSVVYGQASIAGTVQDASGAVLPGVTVEAASPELIEKVRTARHRCSGQYRIENLRPGIYSVTFTLTGFSTFKRDGLELTGLVHRFGQRRAEGRCPRGDDYRHRRDRRSSTSRARSGRRWSATRSSPRCRPRAGYSSLLALVPGIVGGTRDVQTGPCALHVQRARPRSWRASNGEGRTIARRPAHLGAAGQLLELHRRHA